MYDVCTYLIFWLNISNYAHFSFFSQKLKMKLPITGFYYDTNNEQSLQKIQNSTKTPKNQPFQEVIIGQLKCFGKQDTNHLIPGNPKSLMGIF